MSDNRSQLPPHGFVDRTVSVKPWDGKWRPAAGYHHPALDYDTRDLHPGTYLDRVYLGELHRVYVGHALLPQSEVWHRRGWGRFWYDGRRWRTLTAIARHITGDPNLSGNRFFALRRRRRRGGKVERQSLEQATRFLSRVVG